MGHIVEVVEGGTVREDWVDIDLLDVWQVRHTVRGHVQIFLCGQNKNSSIRVPIVLKGRIGALG